MFANQKEELEFLRAELVKNQQAMQEFVYTVSHDLGAPLRAVTSFSRLLDQKYADKLDEKGLNYLAFVVEGGAKAQAMLAGMLQYSRVSTRGSPVTSVDLANIIEGCVQNLRPKIVVSGVRLLVDEMPMVEADEDLMRQLFGAVIDNALTYRRTDVTPQINISAEDTEDMWKISVSDNGIGIPESAHKKVFQIFKKLHSDEVYAGVGLGLALARRIVEKHGGEIGLATADGGGTTCWFTLPKARLEILDIGKSSQQVQHA